MIKRTLSGESSPSGPASNLRAILLLAGAMSGFALADTLIRLAATDSTGQASSGQIIMFLGSMGLLIFSIMMHRTGERFTRDLIDRVVIVRSLSDVTAVVCFMSALTLMPVGDATAILQVQPLVVMIGAVFVLKERVDRWRWLAAIVGFLGVLFIVQPGAEGFSPASLFVLIAVGSLALRDLTTRMLDTRHATQTISALVCLGMIPTGLTMHILTGQESDLSGTVAAYLILTSLIANGSYYFMTMAMRMGEVSVLAPFRYVRLVTAFLFAFIILGERPEVQVLLGSALVMAAGLASVFRERTKNRQ